MISSLVKYANEVDDLILYFSLQDKEAHLKHRDDVCKFCYVNNEWVFIRVLDEGEI